MDWKRLGKMREREREGDERGFARTTMVASTDDDQLPQVPLLTSAVVLSYSVRYWCPLRGREPKTTEL